MDRAVRARPEQPTPRRPHRGRAGRRRGSGPPWPARPAPHYRHPDRERPLSRGLGFACRARPPRLPRECQRPRGDGWGPDVRALGDRGAAAPGGRALGRARAGLPRRRWGERCGTRRWQPDGGLAPRDHGCAARRSARTHRHARRRTRGRCALRDGDHRWRGAGGSPAPSRTKGAAARSTAATTSGERARAFRACDDRRERRSRAGRGPPL